jgi:hypothetical protein
MGIRDAGSAGRFYPFVARRAAIPALERDRVAAPGVPRRAAEFAPSLESRVRHPFSEESQRSDKMFRKGVSDPTFLYYDTTLAP